MNRALSVLSHDEFEVLQTIARKKSLVYDELMNVCNFGTRSELNEIVKRLGKVKFIIASAHKGECSITPEGLDALEPYRVKRAVILAAGKGTRMLPETSTTPKPMVRVGARRIIETQLDALLVAGINDITIVRGYLGEMFDQLLHDYPMIRFIDNPHWKTAEAIVSAQVAADLLGSAYLLEGDLFIRNADIIRPYEYRSSYCGVRGDVADDWHFYTNGAGRIGRLMHGDSDSGLGELSHRFVGIMHWTTEHAKRLKGDLELVVGDPNNNHRFVESIPFDNRTSSYDIFERQIQHDDVVEVDTHDELRALRQTDATPFTD